MGPSVAVDLDRLRPIHAPVAGMCEPDIPHPGRGAVVGEDCVDVVGDLALNPSGRNATRKYRHPGTVDEGRFEGCEAVDRPVGAAVVTEGEPRLEEKRGSLD